MKLKKLKQYDIQVLGSVIKQYKENITMSLESASTTENKLIYFILEELLFKFQKKLVASQFSKSTSINITKYELIVINKALINYESNDVLNRAVVERFKLELGKHVHFNF